MGIKEFQLAIAKCNILFIDTMIFVYLLEDHPLFGDIASVLVKEIEKGRVKGVTSTLTIAELLTAPAGQGYSSIMHDYELYLTNFPHLEIWPLDVTVARRAANVRGKTKLKMPDAIQVATAQSAKVDAIVTNDRQWLNKVEQPNVLLLSNYSH